MSAHTVVAVLNTSTNSGRKVTTFTATGSASYDSGGSTIDLSTSGVLGVEAGFTVVHGCRQVGLANGGAANSKYYHSFIVGSSYSPTGGKIKIHDLSQAADAETSGDLSAITFIYEAVGR